MAGHGHCKGPPGGVHGYVNAELSEGGQGLGGGAIRNGADDSE